MCVLSIKVPILKKSGNLFNDPRRFNSALMFIHVGTIIYSLVCEGSDMTHICVHAW